MEAMKWMTVQLTWQREDGNLSEIAAWLLRFDRSVELISSHYLLEKDFNQKVREWNMIVYTLICVHVCVCEFLYGGWYRERSSAKLLDHADDAKVFHYWEHEKQ